jgi:serine/threonine protein kinase
VSNLQSIDTGLRQQNNDIQFIRQEVEAEARLRQNLNIQRTSAIKIDFFAGDERLRLVCDESGTSGTLEGKAIVLADVNEDEMRVGGRGSRHVEIYKRISVGTFVQSFYGICERDGKKYAVLEDLRKEPTLAVAIQNSLLSDETQRLRVAYDLANTMAYFHSVGILLKSLSDDSVVLRRLDDGTLQPCLTNLETARMVRCLFP